MLPATNRKNDKNDIKNKKKRQENPDVFRLFQQILNGTEILVSTPEISVCQVQIGFLSYCYTGMAQDSAQSINVHTVHKTALGKIVAQGVGRVFFLDACAYQVTLKTGFEGVNLYGGPGLDREQQFAAGIAILIPQPALETFSGFGREENETGMSALCIFSGQTDCAFIHIQIVICNLQAFSYAHSGIKKQQDNHKITVF